MVYSVTEKVFDFFETYNLSLCYSEWGNEMCSDCDLLAGLSESHCSLEIFPNPTSKDIFIRSTKPFRSVFIYNSSGIESMAFDLGPSNSAIIPTTLLNPGPYIIRILFLDNSFSSTVIVKMQ